MGQLENKIAIVTGAGSGFGEGIAKLYAREGAKVVLADINEVAAQRVAGEIGADALAVKTDVSVRADIDRAVALFLASDAAEFITGIEMPVDGGRTV